MDNMCSLNVDPIPPGISKGGEQHKDLDRAY